MMTMEESILYGWLFIEDLSVIIELQFRDKAYFATIKVSVSLRVLIILSSS